MENFDDKYKKKNRTQTPKKRLGYAVYLWSW